MTALKMALASSRRVHTSLVEIIHVLQQSFGALCYGTTFAIASLRIDYQ